MKISKVVLLTGLIAFSMTHNSYAACLSPEQRAALELQKGRLEETFRIYQDEMRRAGCRKINGSWQTSGGNVANANEYCGNRDMMAKSAAAELRDLKRQLGLPNCPKKVKPVVTAPN